MSGIIGGDDAPIVDVENLEKTYGGSFVRRKRRVDALRGVTLQSRPGEVFGLLGPNGAGKTTLIKVLLGVVRPTSGRASLFGQGVGSVMARRRVGYLPESLSIDPHHSARSALKYYGRLSGLSGADIQRRSDELLDTVGLKNRDKESVKRFSKGMRQRLGLAQALMHNPDLLVLDEPTDGLDPVGRSEVRFVIERLRDQGKTIFLNSHILQEVEMVCSHAAILAKGKIRGIGRIEDLTQVTEAQRRVEVDVLYDGEVSRRTIDQVAGQVVETGMTLNVSDVDSGVARVALNAGTQASVDQLIDLLRGSQISIQRVEVMRATLEDAFIHLVGDDNHVDTSEVVAATAEIVEADPQDQGDGHQ